MSGTSIATACLCPVAALCPNNARKVCLSKTLTHTKASCFPLYGCWMVKRPKLTICCQCSMNVPLPVRLTKVVFSMYTDAKKIPLYLCYVSWCHLFFSFVIEWQREQRWYNEVPMPHGRFLVFQCHEGHLSYVIVIVIIIGYSISQNWLLLLVHGLVSKLDSYMLY